MHRLGCCCALFLLGLAAGACEDPFPVQNCESGQGYDLDDEGVPSWGDLQAVVELTLFVDFQCPYSHQLALRLWDLAQQAEERPRCALPRYLVRHMPSSLHNRARPAAIAAVAAARQGDDAFWSMFWFLFQEGEDLSDEMILVYAQAAGLELEQFAADLADPATEEVVERDLQIAQQIGFAGTPGVLLCGIRMPSDQDLVLDNLEYLLCD
jgi:protein-disulfide isomerase